MNRGLIILGVLLLMASPIVALYYRIEYYDIFGNLVRIEYPLLPYGFVLAIVAIIVLVLGLVIPKKVETPPTTRLCPQCGRMLTEEARFCPYCGKELG